MECVGHGEVKNLEDKPAKKMYIQIVKQLHELIEEQNIQEGQKLPSERMLSEQLQVGRSSVREALRSLELLGLIETRHGGGTYLSSMQHHQFVEIVGSFILQDENRSRMCMQQDKCTKKKRSELFASRSI